VTFDFDRIDITDLSRHFGRRKAVSRVSLSLRSGDILGLLGPNGAGKSTLLGMLATLVAPTSGSVTYGEAKASHRGEAIRGRIGVLAVLSLYTSVSAIVKAEMFPPEVRALGVGFAYAIGNAVFGGTAELVALSLKKSGHESVYGWYVMAMMIVFFLVSLRLPRKPRYLDHV